MGLGSAGATVTHRRRQRVGSRGVDRPSRHRSVDSSAPRAQPRCRQRTRHGHRSVAYGSAATPRCDVDDIRLYSSPRRDSFLARKVPLRLRLMLSLRRAPGPMDARNGVAEPRRWGLSPPAALRYPAQRRCPHSTAHTPKSGRRGSSSPAARPYADRRDPLAHSRTAGERGPTRL